VHLPAGLAAGTAAAAAPVRAATFAILVPVAVHHNQPLHAPTLGIRLHITFGARNIAIPLSVLPAPHVTVNAASAARASCSLTSIAVNVTVVHLDTGHQLHNTVRGGTRGKFDPPPNSAPNCLQPALRIRRAPLAVSQRRGLPANASIIFNTTAGQSIPRTDATGNVTLPPTVTERVLAPLVLEALIARVVVCVGRDQLADGNTSGTTAVTHRRATFTDLVPCRGATPRGGSAPFVSPSLAAFVENVSDHDVRARRIRTIDSPLHLLLLTAAALGSPSAGITAG
jgi:hypothetical protein